MRLAISLGVLLGLGHGWLASEQRLPSTFAAPVVGLQSVRPTQPTFPY